MLADVTLLARQPQPALRGEVRATHVVVAAGRTFTVDAGARLMGGGGNAIDGGIAAIFAASVVEISHFGVGGEAPIIIYSARDQHVIVVNGQGSEPKAATPQLFAGKDVIPGNGPLGATLPAVVDSTAIALAKYGTKSLSDVLQPAIELADGFPMYEFLHHYLETERAACEPYAWTMRTYYPGGQITPVGAMFRQPNLAATLRALASAEKAARARGASREEAIDAGRDAFYKGSIARDMTAAVRDAGGVVTEDDLAAYHGKIEEPASAPYRGYTVYKAGFWNQGPVLLQTLRILEGFNLAAMGAGSADAVHTTVEAMKLAYADRDRYYGDPDFVRVPGEVLLSGPYATLRRQFVLGHSQPGLAARRRVRGRRDRRADEQPDAGVQPRSLEPERARRRQAAADDAHADHRAPGRPAVPRDRHARRRQSGSADPAGAAQHPRLRNGRTGRHRGAARELAASRQLVR